MWKMVVLSLPLTADSFEGKISHVSSFGKELFAFIKPTKSKEEQEKIRSKLQNLAPSLQKFTFVSDIKSGKFILDSNLVEILVAQKFNNY